MTEEQPQPSSDQAIKDIEERLYSLRREALGTSVRPAEDSRSVGQLMWLAFNVVSDLIAGVICGLGIGYGIDYWLGTRPVFIAVFLILGCIAGVLNVVRFLNQYAERQHEKLTTPKEKE